MTDQAVYDDLCRADTIGVFQVESRAQMNTLPRLQPRSFYDLVVEVAIIRPGPIQGDMVNPYLRRRLGEEAVTFAHPSLEPVLKRTLGVPLFQEQGMQVAVTAAGFTPGQADVLRKAMGHKRSREKMAAICEQLHRGHGRTASRRKRPKRIYNQINAFADYGIPRIARRQLRLDRVRVGVPAPLLRAGVPRGHAQRPADGVLLGRHADRGRAPSWREGSPDRSDCFSLGSFTRTGGWEGCGAVGRNREET